MNAIERFRLFIDAMDQRDFFKYCALGMAFVVLLMGSLFFYFNHKEASLMEDIETLNEQREKVRHVLEVARRVKRQRAEVDAMLASDESFKLVGYIENVLKELNLSNKWTIQEPSEIDQENNYRETIVKVNLIDVDMKLLCELLQKLDQNKRVYSKELEIIKSKSPGAIEVNITIATLEPKTVPT